MVNAVYPVPGRNTELPFYLSGVGKCSPEYNVVRDKGLVSHQFLMTAAGVGELFVGGRRFLLDRGSIFYLAPEIPHEYRPIDGQWDTCWIVFRGGLALQLLENMGFKGCAVKTDADISRLLSLFEIILHSAADPVSGGERCSQLVYEFVLAARRLMLLDNGHKSSYADKAVSFIDKNYMRDISLDELSGVCGVSPQHFCRLFKAATGMRPTEYILSKRISEAKLMLLSSSKSIAEIAMLTGFSNQNYFGICFRKATGLTPSDFRRQRL